MLKFFRVWDGKAYWYSDNNFIFINGYDARTLHEASDYFKHEDIEQSIGKVDQKGIKIYENDVIYNPMLDEYKLFHVIWSDTECGFRKVPLHKNGPVTKIDEAFMKVIGSIRDYQSN